MGEKTRTTFQHCLSLRFYKYTMNIHVTYDNKNTVQRMWPSWEFISVLSFIHYIICGGIWHTKALKRFLKRGRNEIKKNKQYIGFISKVWDSYFFCHSLNNTQLVDVFGPFTTELLVVFFSCLCVCAFSYKLLFNVLQTRAIQTDFIFYITKLD